MKKSCYLIICFFFINSFILNAQRICGSAINDKAMSKQYREYRVMSRIGAHKMKNEIDKLPDKIIIPVVVHVIHKGEPIGVGYNISDEQIKSQIDVLNEDFNRQNADKVNTPPIFKNIAARIGIEFKLANIDPNGSPTNGIIRKKGVLDKYSHQVDNVKTERYGDISWDTKKYLNIWVCDIDGGVLGYATFPFQFEEKKEKDGVVIRTDSFGRKGNVSSPYNKGRTATHEVGHWLNLIHIWGDEIGCKNGSDKCDDTPDHYGPNYKCYQEAISCSTTGDMYMNYMDYTEDACMNLFTEDQKKECYIHLQKDKQESL